MSNRPSNEVSEAGRDSIVSPRAAVLSRVSAKIIYGTIVVAAVVGSLSDPLPSNLTVTLTVSLSLLAIMLANTYASSINEDLTSRTVASWRECRSRSSVSRPSISSARRRVRLPLPQSSKRRFISLGREHGRLARLRSSPAQGVVQVPADHWLLASSGTRSSTVVRCLGLRGVKSRN